MNILPKKRWHVRTKENIARVRKDEAEAAEKEREERLRTENADREARLNILKHKSKQRLLECGVDDDTRSHEHAKEPTEHINLFTDVDHAIKSTNKEHDKDIKDKKEEYEKKIGYLTYLGQDTNEALKKKNWYEVSPSSRLAQSTCIKDTYETLVLKDQDGKPKKRELDVKDGELDWKAKQRYDPINDFKNYCSRKVEANSKYMERVLKYNSDSKIKKSKDKSKNEKELKLQLLREARIKREQQEKYRTELFLSRLHKTCAPSTSTETNKITPKYNSQFNPELARQNYR